MDLLSWDKSAGLFKVQCDVWTQLETEFYVDIWICSALGAD